ncbi:hypothetical protein D3C73_1242280 [compost metagenome]
MIVIVQVVHKLGSGLDNCTKQPLTELVLKQRIGILMEIMFKHMRHNINHSVDCLVFRK